MTSLRIWNLSHPPALMGPCPPPAWVVKRPERLPQPHRGSPLLSSGARTPTGVVPDWLLLLGLVVVVVVVAVVVEVVVVVPPVVDRDEDDEDDDALNPLPRCLGPHPDRLNKPHPEDHPLER